MSYSYDPMILSVDFGYSDLMNSLASVLALRCRINWRCISRLPQSNPCSEIIGSQSIGAFMPPMDADRRDQPSVVLGLRAKQGR